MENKAHDATTHRASWDEAFKIAMDSSASADDKSYWKHEHDAFMNFLDWFNSGGRVNNEDVEVLKQKLESAYDNINLKADFIEASINDLAGMSEKIYDLEKVVSRQEISIDAANKTCETFRLANERNLKTIAKLNSETLVQRLAAALWLEGEGDHVSDLYQPCHSMHVPAYEQKARDILHEN